MFNRKYDSSFSVRIESNTNKLPSNLSFGSSIIYCWTVVQRAAGSTDAELSKEQVPSRARTY